MKITLPEAVKLLNSNRGKIFSAKFIKRTNGEMRKMVCRTDVTYDLKGGPPQYDFAEKKLLPVFDLQKQAHRTIPLDSNLKSLHINHRSYEING